MSDTHQLKKPKMSESRKVIGTHNGTFHCDEALAVFLLRQTATYRNADLTRSRDPALLSTCDIVVDVGAVYDEGKQRFDHHQRGFVEVFGYGFKTKLSSAGLVYKHFGKEIIANNLQLPADDPKTDTVWLKLYKEFIEAIDAIDNGVSQYPKELQPKYRNRTDLSSRVGWLNPTWNEQFDSKTLDAQFDKASSLTGEEFLGRLHYYANSWFPARSLISKALAQRRSVDPSGKIIIFDQFAPWKEHLFELEAEEVISEEDKPIYVLYPDETSGNWRIQAISISPDSFESRKALPEVWRGLRDENLSEVIKQNRINIFLIIATRDTGKTRTTLMIPSNRKLRVVLTNDDGPPSLESPYIFGLYRHLTRDLGFDVKVLIPSTQKSWIGKAYQIRDTIRGQYYYPRDPDGEGEVSDTSRPLKEGEIAQWILLDGTPATCANIALHNLYPDEVDLLISGPNFGRNTSAAFSLSSGTVGAALSSSLSGVRSIALSYGIVLRPTPKSFDEPAHRLSGRIINYLWNNWGATDVLYSINIPMIDRLLDEEGLKIYWTSIWRNNYGRLFAPQASSGDEDETFKGTDADTSRDNVGAGSSQEADRLVFKFSPDLRDILKAESAPSGSDGWAIAQGAVSVSPIHASLAEKQDVEFKTAQDRMWKMKL